MSFYMFLAFWMMYALTAVVLKKYTMRKMWFVAFLLVFFVTAVSLSFLRLTHQEVMMNATELGWYYMLYVFASLSIVLGVINFWIFRKAIWEIISEKPIEGDAMDDDVAKALKNEES